MKIAINAPIWLRVPPQRYGGTELVVSLLAEALVQRGYDVTLFAVGNSLTNAKLSSVFDSPPTVPIGTTLPDVVHSAQAFKRKDFDIIHDHTGVCGMVFSEFVKTPVLSTLHGDSEALLNYFLNNISNAPNLYFNAISRCQQGNYPDKMNFVPVVYNAIDPEHYIFKSEKEDFLLQVGRISPQKGNHLAIETAKRTGNRLVLSGKVDPPDLKYYDEKIAPHVDGENIIFTGEISHEEKIDLLSRAKGFLFPIQWDEPFGLVMIEAMASGTPVIAFAKGAAPEVIDHEETGFLATGLPEFVEMVSKLDEIKPAVCRQRVEERFSPPRMAEAYVNRYEQILAMPATNNEQ